MSTIRTEQEIKEVAALHVATKNIFESKKIKLSRKQKKAIRFELVRNVSFKAAKQLVGGADRTLRGWRALKQSDVDDMWDDEGPTITADGETTKESDQVDCITLNMYAAFFVKHSGVLSGANRERRTLAMPKHKLLSILFGEIPGMGIGGLAPSSSSIHFIDEQAPKVIGGSPGSCKTRRLRSSDRSVLPHRNGRNDLPKHP